MNSNECVLGETVTGVISNVLCRELAFLPDPLHLDDQEKHRVAKLFDYQSVSELAHGKNISLQDAENW